jgi:transmembrane sensor
VLLTLVGAAIGQNQNWTADYRASAGEQRRLALDDGTSVLLDSSTALDIRYTPGERAIYLRSGQALFHVAHDASRPFIVHDGTVTATALGTVYAVRHEDSGPQVTVREGRVAVANESGGQITLVAGQQVRHSRDLMSPTTVDTEESLAWERGVLVFKLAPLADVVAEINRHRRGFILIANPGLRDIQVSGVFRLDELDGAIGTLSSVFPIRTTTVTRYLMILR